MPGLVPGTHAAVPYRPDARLQREKNLKHWPRAWKVRLILDANPSWADLYDSLS